MTILNAVSQPITVSVPATSANLGPGFDCLGLALDWHNHITVGFSSNGDALSASPQSTVAVPPLPSLESLKTQLAFTTADAFFGHLGQSRPPLTITIETHVPLSRGLGSSATVVVGVLVGLNHLLGQPLNTQALFNLATQIEGHPDNVAPALLGGLQLCVMEQTGEPKALSLPWPTPWGLTAVVPQAPVATHEARSCLPPHYSLAQAVHNAGAVGTLVHALHTANPALLKQALHDELHQPYRAQHQPVFAALLETFNQDAHKDSGTLWGVTLSGSGSSVLLWHDKTASQAVKPWVTTILSQLNTSPVNLFSLSLSHQGAAPVTTNFKH